jgi:hypothetical protein
MMLNATFNNISAIMRRQVLLVEETGMPSLKDEKIIHSKGLFVAAITW